MRTAKFCLLLCCCLFLAACGSSPQPAPAASVLRAYNGTASVGDFLTISLDASTKTITYNNHTNGENGTVPYTINTDGSYTITDPNGNLLSAYEVPGFLMVVEAANAGPNRDTKALITAIESVPASIHSFAAQNFNYLQFRTNYGGTEIGTVSIDAQGDIQHAGYSPAGGLSQPPQYFHSGTFTSAGVHEDASGNFFTIDETDGSSDVVFGTQNGLWAVDAQFGAILGLPKAASKNFDPSVAGTYNAIYYEKPNAQMGPNNIESGTAQEGKASITVGTNGSVTIKDSQGNTMASGTLVPVANKAYIYDGTANTLPDGCYGLFTFQTTTASSEQDVFASFQGNAVIFGSFETALPLQQNAAYTYFYGVGLK